MSTSAVVGAWRQLLEQLELQLADLEESAAEDEAGGADRGAGQNRRCRAVRAPRSRRAGRCPEHLPRERVVYPAPVACPCCGGAAAQARRGRHRDAGTMSRARWKVIQHVREKFSCRACETITQPPAPFHPIARGRAGPHLLAHDPVRQIRPAPAAQPPERRPMPAKASISTSRRWPTGSVPRRRR